MQFNVLTVVNRGNGSHGQKVYRFLKSQGARYIQFIPIVERLPISQMSDDAAAETTPANARASRPENFVTDRSVGPRQFGRFLIEIFDEWLRKDVGRVFVQIFDEALAAWLGVGASLCVFKKECGRALAIEHNGDVFSCDHFVSPEYKLGNIHELPIVELANSPRQQKFGRDKQSTLPAYCRECEVRFVCNGECPKNRFLQTPDGEAGLNYLCAGYKMFFQYIDPHMKAMAKELRNGQPPANVMHRLNAERRRAGSTQNAPPNRNAPCPCGSGKKFKHCCLRR